MVFIRLSSFIRLSTRSGCDESAQEFLPHKESSYNFVALPILHRAATTLGIR